MAQHGWPLSLNTWIKHSLIAGTNWILWNNLILFLSFSNSAVVFLLFVQWLFLVTCNTSSEWSKLISHCQVQYSLPVSQPQLLLLPTLWAMPAGVVCAQTIDLARANSTYSLTKMQQVLAQAISYQQVTKARVHSARSYDIVIMCCCIMALSWQRIASGDFPFLLTLSTSTIPILCPSHPFHHFPILPPTPPPSYSQPHPSSHTLPPRPIPHPLSVGVKCFHRVLDDGPTECVGYFCETIVYIKDAMAEPVSVNHCINSTRFCLSEVFMNHDGFLYKIFGCCTTDYCNRNLSTAGLPLNYMEYLTRKPLSSESVHMYVHMCVCVYIHMHVCLCVSVLQLLLLSK